MIKKTMGIIWLLVLVFSMTVFSGCSKEKDNMQTQQTVNENQESSQKQDEEKPQEPTKIRWVRATNVQDPEKDRILLELQKRLNIKLEILGLNGEGNKLEIMVASGEPLDLINGDPGTTLNGWAKNGLILSWDEYLKSGKYPLINSIVNSEMYKNLKIDGKVYYKPLPIVPTVWGPIIRQDWLDNLGLKMPTTVEEFKNVLRAFTKNDPDKNGKNDTYGYTVLQATDSIALLRHAFTLGENVLLSDGTAAKFEFSENARKFAEAFRDIYKEGLINRDWLTATADDQDRAINEFITGKVGIVYTTRPGDVEDKIKNSIPNAKLEYLPPIEGTLGLPPTSGNSGGFWWGNIIPATCKNPEKVLELLEYSLTEEGRELTQFGIKGIHYSDVKEENGVKIYTINKSECDKDWDTAKYSYLYPLSWGGLNNFEYSYIPIKEHNYNFDEAFKNYKLILPDDKAKGQFVNWNILNSKYAQNAILQNVYDQKVLMNKKLGMYWTEALAKCVLSKNENEFEKIWSTQKEKWLKGGGEVLNKNINEYYQAHK